MMASLITENFETVAPSAADAVLARESSRLLATRKFGRRTSVRIQLLDDRGIEHAFSMVASADDLIELSHEPNQRFQH